MVLELRMVSGEKYVLFNEAAEEALDVLTEDVVIEIFREFGSERLFVMSRHIESYAIEDA